MLLWKFDGVGAWEAFSDAATAMWRIVVCDDGTFDVSGSDPGLTDRKGSFCGLESAKAFCRYEDNKLEKPNLSLANNQARCAARDAFREWNDVAGIFQIGSSYYAEILGVIDDAVDFGWKAAKEQ